MPNHLQKVASNLGAAAKDVEGRGARVSSGVSRHLMEEAARSWC